MQNVSKITFVILGAIIGAGFISGQEINIFFNIFGTNGIIGIIISGIIFGIIINKTCLIIKEKNVKNYENFIKNIFPVKNKYFIFVFNNVISIFLLISFFIMCSGVGCFFYQELGIPIFITGIINCIFSYYIFISNKKLLFKINEILMPIIILSIFFLFIKNNININIKTYNISFNLINIIFNGIVYASYNTILLIPIIITLNNYIYSKNQIKIISLICSIINIILAIMIFLLINNIEINSEMPLLNNAYLLGKEYYYIYSFIVLFAIITTEISVGYGFLNNISKENKNIKIPSIIICILSIFISNIGFSNLISLIYPVFGIIGIIQIFFILKY